MNCNTHTDRTAVAVCVNCGAAMCVDCCTRTVTRKHVCSPECAAAANAKDDTLAAIATRSRTTTRATAWFCWLLGALFGGVGGLYVLGGGEDRVMAFFFLASSAVTMFTGLWFRKIGRRASNSTIERDARKSGARPSL